MIITAGCTAVHHNNKNNNNNNSNNYSINIKGVMTRSIVDALAELCSLFLKGGNSAFIAVIASGLFSQTEYRSLE